MKRIISNLGLLVLVSAIYGCSKAPKVSTTPTVYKKELAEEGFPGIILEVDSRLAHPHNFGDEIELKFILTNNRDHAADIEYARFRLVSANLGNGKSTVTRTKKIETKLEAGQSLEFGQYFYIGPNRGSLKPEEGVSQWLGEVAGGSTKVAPRNNGDILIGVVMGLKIDGKPNYDIFVSKHYFDESKNTITPYYTFGTPKAEQVEAPDR